MMQAIDSELVVCLILSFIVSIPTLAGETALPNWAAASSLIPLLCVLCVGCGRVYC